jgi:alpha,alpha-trehalose phosphorylase
VVQPHEATYDLRTNDGAAQLRLSHHGESLNLTTDRSVTRPIPVAKPVTDTPTQPAGRSPIRRRDLMA